MSPSNQPQKSHSVGEAVGGPIGITVGLFENAPGGATLGPTVCINEDMLGDDDGRNSSSASTRVQIEAKYMSLSSIHAVPFQSNGKSAEVVSPLKEPLYPVQTASPAGFLTIVQHVTESRLSQKAWQSTFFRRTLSIFFE